MSGPIRPTSRRRLPGRPPYVVTALRRKYAEMLGWEDAEGIATIGAALLIFEPGEDLSAIAPVRPYKANRERWSRTALTILRTSGNAMTGRELARAVMERHSVARNDFMRLTSIEVSLHITLDRLVGDGIVKLPGEPKRWMIG